MGDEDLIYGLNPVLALLQERARAVEVIYLTNHSRNPRLAEVFELARAHKIPFHQVERAVLERMTNGGVHQGVAARVGARAQPTWEELLARVTRLKHPLLLILDQIEDPRNLGAILRSAEAFGVDGVVTTKLRAAPLSATAEKSSAGAALRVDLVRVANLAQAITTLREAGFVVYGLEEGGTGERLHAMTWPRQPLALVLGNEGSGLRRLTRERCDDLVGIAISGGVGSLNVAVAAGIALYEVRRQWG